MNLLYVNIGDWLSALAIIGILLIVVFIIVVIRLICAVFEMNKNIRDIRTILIQNYNENHPDDHFREQNPYNEVDYSGMLH